MWRRVEEGGARGGVEEGGGGGAGGGGGGVIDAEPYKYSKHTHLRNNRSAAAGRLRELRK